MASVSASSAFDCPVLVTCNHPFPAFASSPNLHRCTSSPLSDDDDSISPRSALPTFSIADPQQLFRSSRMIGEGSRTVTSPTPSTSKGRRKALVGKMGTIGKRVVQEVLGGSGNNPAPVKGDIIPTYGRGGAARPKVRVYGATPLSPPPAPLGTASQDLGVIDIGPGIEVRVETSQSVLSHRRESEHYHRHVDWRLPSPTIYPTTSVDENASHSHEAASEDVARSRSPSRERRNSFQGAIRLRRNSKTPVPLDLSIFNPPPSTRSPSYAMAPVAGPSQAPIPIMPPTPASSSYEEEFPRTVTPGLDTILGSTETPVDRGRRAARRRSESLEANDGSDEARRARELAELEQELEEIANAPVMVPFDNEEAPIPPRRRRPLPSPPRNLVQTSTATFSGSTSVLPPLQLPTEPDNRMSYVSSVWPPSTVEEESPIQFAHRAYPGSPMPSLQYSDFFNSPSLPLSPTSPLPFLHTPASPTPLFPLASNAILPPLSPGVDPALAAAAQTSIQLQQTLELFLALANANVQLAAPLMQPAPLVRHTEAQAPPPPPRPQAQPPTLQHPVPQAAPTSPADLLNQARMSLIPSLHGSGSNSSSSKRTSLAPSQQTPTPPGSPRRQSTGRSLTGSGSLRLSLNASVANSALASPIPLDPLALSPIDSARSQSPVSFVAPSSAPSVTNLIDTRPVSSQLSHEMRPHSWIAEVRGWEEISKGTGLGIVVEDFSNSDAEQTDVSETVGRPSSDSFVTAKESQSGSDPSCTAQTKSRNLPATPLSA